MSLKCVICGLVLAAGTSSRMDGFKPLMPLRGKALIENTVDSILAGGAEQVVAVTGYRGEELELLLKERYAAQVITVRNPDFAHTDMMESVRIGCRAMPGCDAFFLLPGDMPVIRPSTFQKLISERPADRPSIVFPTLEGYRKHPPLVDSRLIPDILSFRGNGGLRQLWTQHTDLIHTVPVDDDGVWVDLDTQADYKKCKQKYEF